MLNQYVFAANFLLAFVQESVLLNVPYCVLLLCFYYSLLFVLCGFKDVFREFGYYV